MSPLYHGESAFAAVTIFAYLVPSTVHHALDFSIISILPNHSLVPF